MNRRGFLASALTVATLPLLVPVQRWIGEPAGGVYVPLPDDFAGLSKLVQWSDWQYLYDMPLKVRNAMMFCVWAAPGSSLATVQCVGGTITMSESECQSEIDVAGRKEENLLNLLRDLVERNHEPGWLNVKFTEATTEPHGEPYFYRSVQRWKRVGYLRWVNPSQFSKDMLIGVSA